MDKLNMRDDILQSMSTELYNLVNMQFGEVQPVNMPGTKDEAIVTTGQVNANFNNAILVPLSGVRIVELLLRAGQWNEVYRGLLLASIQQSKDYSDFEIVEPIAGLNYAMGENTITIRVSEGVPTNITCTVYDPSNNGSVIGEFFVESGDLWWASIEYTEAGTWSLTFVVRFESGTVRTRTAEVTVS